jgi:hypothetical protein
MHVTGQSVGRISGTIFRVKGERVEHRVRDREDGESVQVRPARDLEPVGDRQDEQDARPKRRREMAIKSRQRSNHDDEAPLTSCPETKHPPGSTVGFLFGEPGFGRNSDL